MTVSEDSNFLSNDNISSESDLEKLENIALSISYSAQFFNSISNDLERLEKISVYSSLLIRHTKFLIAENIQHNQKFLSKYANSWINFDYSQIFNINDILDYVICFKSSDSLSLTNSLMTEIGAILTKKEFQLVLSFTNFNIQLKKLSFEQLLYSLKQIQPQYDINQFSAEYGHSYTSIYYRDYIFNEDKELIEDFFEHQKIASNLEEDILLTKEAIEDFFSKVSHHLNDTRFQHDYAELMDQVLREKLQIENHHNNYLRERHNIEDSFSINEFCTISEVFDFWIRDYKNKGFGEVKTGRNYINSILQKYETEAESDLDLYTRNILFRHFSLGNLYVRKLSLELDLKHGLIINDQGFTISNSAKHAGVVLEPNILDLRVKTKAAFIFSY